MKRVAWLLVIAIVGLTGPGCQSVKFPTPKWPKMAMFKDPPRLFQKKEKDPAPPSEHFDGSADQMAAAADAKKKPTEIPGEGSGTKLPSASAKPSGLLADSGKSATGPANSKSANQDADDKKFQLSPIPSDFEAPPVAGAIAGGVGAASVSATGSGPAPSRKPYSYSKPDPDSLNQAAAKLAEDWERQASEAASSPNRDAVSSAGQFKPQNAFAQDRAAPRDSIPPWLSDPSPGNKTATEAPNPLSPKSNPIAAQNPSPPAEKTPDGNANFNPSTFPSSAQNGQPDSGPSRSGNTGIPPWKTFSASSPATHSMPNGQSNSIASNPTINDSAAGAPGAAKPSAAPLAPSSRSPLTGGDSPDLKLPESKLQGLNLAERDSAPAKGIQNPGSNRDSAPEASRVAESNRYPSTNFQPYAPTRGPIAKVPSDPMANASPPASRINGDWSNQPSPVVSPNLGGTSAGSQPVSHTAELPPELLQRQGTYAPGSTRLTPGQSGLWR